MKRNFVRMISAFLTIAAILSMAIPTFAKEVSEDDLIVEVIPNEVIEATLPENLRDALNSGIVPYGTSKPSSSSIHNFEEDGRYYFSVTTKLETTIYSNCVFTGHDGSVKFHIYDSSTDTGGYTVKVFKKGIIDTTVYTKNNCPHGESTDFYVSIDDPDAKIYFAIIPEGRTYIQDNSYIDKE